MLNIRIVCMFLFIFINMNLCLSKIFKIAWIVPGSFNRNNINSETSVGALKLALQSVSKNTKILNGHTIKIKHFDMECGAQSAMMAAMLARNSYDPDVIIGPPCTEAMKVVAQLGSFWNLPTLGWYNPEITFDKQTDYSTLLRLSPPNHILGKSLLHLMKQHSWKKFALIYHSDTSWVNLKSTIETAVLPTDIRVLSTQKVKGNTTDYELQQMFIQIKKYASIMVFACPGHLIRQYMLAANTVGMGNGEFVFIQLDHQIYSDTVLNKQVIGDGAWKRGDMYDNAARRIMESLIHVMIDPMNDNKKPTDVLPRSRYTDFVRLVTGSVISNVNWELPATGKKPDVYSLYLYDVVLVWTVLVDSIIKAGLDPRNAKIMSRYVAQIYADGATGYIAMDTDLDRLGKIFILDMNNNGQFKPVQILKFNSSTSYNVLNMSPVTNMYRWGNGKSGSHFTPTDEPTPEVMGNGITPMPFTTTTDSWSIIMSRLKSLEQKLLANHANHGHGHIPYHTHTPNPLLAKLSTSAPVLKPLKQQQTPKRSKYNTNSNVWQSVNTKQTHSKSSSNVLQANLNRLDTNYKTNGQTKPIAASTYVRNIQHKKPTYIHSVSANKANQLKPKQDKTVQSPSRLRNNHRSIFQVGYIDTQYVTVSPPIKATAAKKTNTHSNRYTSVKPLTKPHRIATERETIENESFVTNSRRTLNKPKLTGSKVKDRKLTRKTQKARLVTTKQNNAPLSNSLIDRISTRVVDQLTGRITRGFDKIHQRVSNVTASEPTEGAVGDWMSNMSEEMTPEIAMALQLSNSPIPFLSNAQQSPMFSQNEDFLQWQSQTTTVQPRPAQTPYFNPYFDREQYWPNNFAANQPWWGLI